MSKADIRRVSLIFFVNIRLGDDGIHRNLSFLLMNRAALQRCR